MKKYLIMFVCIGLLFVVAGCGEEKDKDDDSSKSSSFNEKVLKCTEDGSSYEDRTLVFTFDKKGEEIIGFSNVIEHEYDDDELEYITQSDVDSFCDGSDNISLVESCSAKLIGNLFTANVVFDVDNYNFLYFGFDTDTTIEKAKTILEDGGMTCKVGK